MDNWWNELQKGISYEFGMMQVDVAGHSHWKGNKRDQQKTKENIKVFIDGIVSGCYNGIKLSWPGDGGQFLFFIREQDVDPLVACCFHVLRDQGIFNSLFGVWTYLEMPVSLRISAHIGTVLFNGDRETLHGDSLNFFLKHERQLSDVNSVSITEDVFERLRSNTLRQAFNRIDEHDLVGLQEKYKRAVYRSGKTDFELRGKAAIFDVLDDGLEERLQDLKNLFDIFKDEDSLVVMEILDSRVSQLINELKEKMKLTEEWKEESSMILKKYTDDSEASKKQRQSILPKMLTMASTGVELQMMEKIQVVISIYKQHSSVLDVSKFKDRLELVFQQIRDDRTLTREKHRKLLNQVNRSNEGAA